MISTCSLELLAIGFPVRHRGAQGLDLAGMVAAADTKDHPAAGQDVGGHKALGETQRVTHRRDGEGACRSSGFRHMGEMHGRHQIIWDARSPRAGSGARRATRCQSRVRPIFLAIASDFARKLPSRSCE
jgi:hypothetical protein